MMELLLSPTHKLSSSYLKLHLQFILHVCLFTCLVFVCRFKTVLLVWVYRLYF